MCCFSFIIATTAASQYHVTVCKPVFSAVAPNTCTLFCAHSDVVVTAVMCFAQMSADMATDHVNGNGTEEPMDTTAAVTHSEHFQALLEAGLSQKVSEKLDELYVAGKKTFGGSFFF